MDTLDVRILRRIFQGRSSARNGSALRDSLATIAREVGVDEDTVRNRLRRFQDSGLIPCWRLYVNPRLWGAGQMGVWVDTGPGRSNHEVIEKLRPIPGILIVYACYDGLVAFLEYDREWSIPRLAEVVRDATGARDAVAARVVFPECTTLLADRDWQLIRALRWNPWRSYAQLATDVGLSTRTTRARMSRIFAQRVLFAWPALNFRSLEGGLLVHLGVGYSSDRKAEIDGAVAVRLEPFLWHSIDLIPVGRSDDRACCYNLIVPNVTVGQEALAWVRGLPGVHGARLHLNEDVYNFFDAYDERLGERLAGALPLPSRRRSGQMIGRRIPAGPP